MIESPPALFEALVQAAPPGDATLLFDTACVIGGGIAGLLAARVLSDRARRVVVIEPDDLSGTAGPRPGVPQGLQVHTLLPGGQQWLERWVPGLTKEAQERGASLVPGQGTTFLDGVPQALDAEGHHLLAIGRPLLESLIRDRVVSRPGVTVLRGRAIGLRYDGDAVDGVRYTSRSAGDQGDNGARVLDVDFVVDAMGRSSRLSSWLGDSGYDQPRLERLGISINYATALFERSVELADLERPGALALFTPGHSRHGVSTAAVQPIEGMRWIAMLMGYGDSRPGRTVAEFRAACAALPPVFAEAVAGDVVGGVETYHQADNRRRHFADADHLPARLVAVGDAVASFNPIYGQGMSSAALHASCLAAYLGGAPDLDAVAREFYRTQQVVVDAAWAVSAGGDGARLDAQNGTDVPQGVRERRRAMDQIAAATLVDGELAHAFNDVSYMLRHPAVLADPELLARAVAANERAA
ncbi:FAD-dependent oxidoreductase [Promicromonospora thailandica]|uniref:2-polyprenyl-6-methoxyphenol hydroxylase n=1 Tax=Promicromonospora thailandica TaxID=765201 RepID=A0A9X2G528_9MICO|nr:FAD-dependent monooxygenase [Promicromonospora thailandica]MCP2267217.1 2-polyprenyl-6-methoxyphenol hydroxylase [Promicromonospora thailandica]BFF17474.1 FAD-binding monooxygenase [Promicromonospora thailandica]